MLELLDSPADVINGGDNELMSTLEMNMLYPNNVCVAELVLVNDPLQYLEDKIIQ